MRLVPVVTLLALLSLPAYAQDRSGQAAMRCLSRLLSPGECTLQTPGGSDPLDLRTGTTLNGGAVGGGGGGPTDATYLVQDLHASLSAEIAFGAAVSNQFVTGATGGAITRAQPSFSNLSGSALDSQIPDNITIDLATLATSASALTANPADCTAGQYAHTIAANGALTCAQVALSQVSGNYVASVATTAPLTGGAAGSNGAALTIGLNQNAGTDVTADLEEETHATEHQHGGADEIATATPTGNAIPKAGGTGTIDANWIPTTFATDAEVVGYARPIESCIRADATRVLTSTTAEQALFNDPANGRITVGTGTYLFRGRFYLSGMSATSGNAAIDPLGAGTATATAWLWQVIGVDNTNAAVTTTRTGQNVITQQTNASALSAAAGTAMLAEFEGTVEITGAGTMIPSVSLVTAATPTLNLGSYFCIERIGSTTMTSVGVWD